MAILVIYKPLGVYCRSAYRELRSLNKVVCHVGTLDYCATGKLIILTNESVKKMSSFVSLEKGYFFTILVGTRTTSDDIYGKKFDSNSFDLSATVIICAYLKSLSGICIQKVPMISAKRSKGKRLYAMYRNSNHYIKQEKTVTSDVKELQIIDFTNFCVSASVRADGCFYVRSIPQRLDELFNIKSCISYVYRHTHKI